jgi:hypothetical protein
MAHNNNPAGRLLALLRRGKKTDFLKMQAAQAWKVLLAIPQANDLELTHQLVGLAELPLLIKSRVEGIPNVNHELYLKKLPELARTLRGLGFGVQWGIFVKSFSESVLDSLAFCDDLLSRENPDKRVDTDQLGSLLKDVGSLVDDVVASDIDNTLKQYMLKHLHIVERAIQDYQLLGAGPLEQAVEATIGSVFLHKDVAVEVAKTPLGARLWNILGKLAIITTLVVGVPQLPEAVRKLLPTAEEVKDQTQRQESPEIIDAQNSETEDTAEN